MQSYFPPHAPEHITVSDLIGWVEDRLTTDEALVFP